MGLCAGLRGSLTSLVGEYTSFKVTSGSDLVSDLGLDSLSMMLLLCEIEDRFGVGIGADDVPEGVGLSVDLLVRIVEGRASVVR